MIETLIIIVFIIILVLFVSMIFNFKAMLDFKWNIDYFVLKDAICEEYRWTKFEIEGLRYNLSKFLYNDKAFERIIKDYKITYSLITLFASVLFIPILLILLITLFLFMLILIFTCITDITHIKNLIKKFLIENNYDFTKIIILIILIIVAAVIYVIYIAVTSWYLEYLNTLQSYNNDTDIGKYYKCYKILSSIIMMNNLKDQKVELLHPAFTKLSLTFDQLLERNIASYENTGNTSQVKNVKLNAYAKLDFLKYFVFDKLSPYYLKYFDNVYVQNAAGENMYLDDLYTKNLNKNNDILIKSFENIKSIVLKDNTKPYYEIIPSDIDNKDDDEQYEIYTKIRSKFDIINASSYNTNYNNVKKYLKNISSGLEYYQTNQKIKGIIRKSDVDITVEKDDYIKYFIDNNDILFNDEKLSDFKYKLNEYSNAIYIYYVYFSIIFFIISHYFYHTLEGSTYIYTISGIILIYIFIVWLYTQISFMSNTA